MSLTVRADRNDPTVIDHGNAICLQYGRKTVRDDDGGAVLHQTFQRFLAAARRFRKSRRAGGFIRATESAGPSRSLQRSPCASRCPPERPCTAFAQESVVALRRRRMKSSGQPRRAAASISASVAFGRP